MRGLHQVQLRDCSETTTSLACADEVSPFHRSDDSFVLLNKHYCTGVLELDARTISMQ